MSDSSKANSTIRPPLKWAGGKRWLVRHLRPYWEPHSSRRLVEPFCGGLAVTLGLMPQRAVLNDINPHLVSFYKWIQAGLTIDVQMENNSICYYKNRDRFNYLIRDGYSDSREAAQLFYYLNRTGYNGLCRFNSRGEFNVPFGRYRSLKYAVDFLEYRGVLGPWEFMAGDFELLSLEPEDFVYADPPYDVEFTKYSKEDFGWEDQERLALWLSKHPGPVILSNQATLRIVDLYKRLGFRLAYETGPRLISCNGDRTPAREVLALKGVE